MGEIPELPGALLFLGDRMNSFEVTPDMVNKSKHRKLVRRIEILESEVERNVKVIKSLHESLRIVIDSLKSTKP